MANPSALFQRLRFTARFRTVLGAYIRALAEDQPLATLPPPRPFLLGGVPVLPEDAFGNYFILGSRGSGKTLILRLILQSILAEIVQHPWKLLVYDGKNELYSVLCALTDPAHIALVNPLDARGKYWRIDVDLPNIESALEISTIVVPEDKRASQPFFDRAASRLFYGTIVSFMEMKRTGRIAGFGFHDLIFAAQDTKRLRWTLAQSAIGERLAQKYFDVPERTSDVIATLDTKLAPFEPIAESSAEASEPFSLHGWFQGSHRVLLLGTDESNPYAMRAYNRALFARMAELLLAQPNLAPNDPDPARTFVIVEEASKAGELMGLDALSVKGRSKNVTLAILTQSLGGFEALYGREIAQEILGQFGNRAFLRTEEPYTAYFCAQAIGVERKVMYSYNQGVSYSSSGISESFGSSSHIGVEETVLASDFMTIPPTNTSNGLCGYYLTPGYGAYTTHIPPHILFDPKFLLPPADVADFVPRDRTYGRQSPPPAAPPALPPGPSPAGPDNDPPAPDAGTPPAEDEPPLQERRRNIRDFRVGQ